MKTDELVPRSAVYILIVEDSPTQAERLKYTLECYGCQVTCTANGRLALEAARLRKPTLILSDIVMPEMDGYELCQQLKADPELRNIPVILLTSLSDPQDVIRGLECGADNFVIKPYDERFLLSRIQFLLDNDEIHDRGDKGLEIRFNGQQHVITADRLQILNLLLSTYEAAIQRNQELTQAKDSLRAVNALMEATNKELEAFSYSVSHDLRAPLRIIDGFNRSLFEDHAGTLNEEAKDLLTRSLKACHRMGQLIDDLLSLSKLTRADLVHEPVDLSALVESVFADLQKSYPDRQINFNVSKELIASGDRRLLRIVLENLLGNSLKFTSKVPQATLEFGITAQGESRAFYLRDNGAGFDMTYAQKLFGAFQRLHSTAEFPGTGIGLATVQRIITRHGGRIWAEGAVGKGATFYFTLDTQAQSLASRNDLRTAEK